MRHRNSFTSPGTNEDASLQLFQFTKRSSHLGSCEFDDFRQKCFSHWQFASVTLCFASRGRTSHDCHTGAAGCRARPALLTLNSELDSFLGAFKQPLGDSSSHDLPSPQPSFPAHRAKGSEVSEVGEMLMVCSIIVIISG